MPDAVSDPKGPTSDPKDVVRRFFATLGTGDFAAIGELFDFAALAAACRRERRFEFLFAAMPLNLTGAVGSPANAVAIL